MVDGVPSKGRKLQGSMAALVTPFAPDGAVDWACAARLADRQIGAGTDWLVPCATTGESPTLSPEERDRLLGLMIERSRGKCGVLAYTGCNCTAETVRRTVRAAEMGADAAMVVAPYYNRPTPKGLFQHFAAVAEAVDLPLVLYNVPPRTGVSIPNDVVVRLRQSFPHVTAIKHATGSVNGVTDLLQQCDIAVVSGDDSLIWPLMALGAVGAVSVLGNLVPDLIESLVQAGLEGDLLTGQSYHRKVADLGESLAAQGPNPLPIKAAMAAVGLIEEVFRLPLCPVDAGARAEIKALLRRHEIT